MKQHTCDTHHRSGARSTREKHHTCCTHARDMVFVTYKCSSDTHMQRKKSKATPVGHEFDNAPSWPLSHRSKPHIRMLRPLQLTHTLLCCTHITRAALTTPPTRKQTIIPMHPWVGYQALVDSICCCYPSGLSMQASDRCAPTTTRQFRSNTTALSSWLKAPTRT